MDEFRRLLTEIEHRLPLNEPSDLASPDTAYRCFVACNGVISYLMALIRRATRLALMDGREHLDHTLLSLAYDQRLAGERRGIPNPFAEAAGGFGGGHDDALTTPKAGKVKGQGADGKAGGQRSAAVPTMRNSRGRKERTEGLQDLLRK